MQWLPSVLLTIQVITSLSIIVLVLLQQGKGADMGSSFGSGSAGSLFGASGAANFLSRTTKWVAVLFFASTLGLAYVSHHTGDSILDGGLMSDFTSSPAPAAPTGSAVPTAPGASAAEAPAAGVIPAAPATESLSVPSVPSGQSSSSVPAAPPASGAN